MSLQSASTNAVASVKSESSYKSPPSSLSDLSQHEAEGSRGRRQDRERSSTAKADEDSCDEKENGAGTLANGKPRKRKRSRKGLDKNFPCPHHGCGKSYSRAEHLYRHQLNRKFNFTPIFLCSTAFDDLEKILRKKYTFAISRDASGNLCGKICVRDIGNGILLVDRIYKERSPMYRTPMVDPAFHRRWLVTEISQAPCIIIQQVRVRLLVAHILEPVGHR